MPSPEVDLHLGRDPLFVEKADRSFIASRTLVGTHGSRIGYDRTRSIECHSPVSDRHSLSTHPLFVAVGVPVPYRVQGGTPYQDGCPGSTVLSQDFVPLNAMRFLLAMYGMLKYSPRSDSWVRGTLLQGAPTIEEYGTGRGMESMFPLAPRV